MQPINSVSANDACEYVECVVGSREGVGVALIIFLQRHKG